MTSGLLSRIKMLMVRPGRKARKIGFGLLKGARLLIDLQRQTQLYFGLWEREILGWTVRLSRGIRTAVDVGAAEGEYAVFFLLKTGARIVYAFEPGEGERRRLEENIALNRLPDDRLRISLKLVADTDDETHVSLDTALLPAEGCKAPRGPSPFTGPCLVKVDIDGGEYDLLHGAEKLLKRPDVRWIIEVHSVELERACVDLLKHEGYVVKIVPNAWWRCFIPEQRPLAHNRWIVAYRTER